MGIVVVGIDLGKNSCSLAGLDASGRVVLRRRLRRSSLESFVGGLERCIVAMEACCGAHHLGCVFAAQGHAVRLMSPEYVRPYVKAQKNDELDAEAIAEAATRPTMRFVELKSQDVYRHPRRRGPQRGGRRKASDCSPPWPHPVPPLSAYAYQRSVSLVLAKVGSAPDF